MKHETKKSVASVCFVVVFAMWCVWQYIDRFPGFLLVLAFWCLLLSALMLNLLAERLRPVKRLLIIQIFGAVCNASVVLANGGRMPVIGSSHDASVWKMAASTDRLLFLADYKSMWFFSAGDLIAVAAGLWAILLKLWMMKRARKSEASQ